MPVFTTPWSGQRKRGGSFLASLSLHGLAVFLILWADYMQPPLELHLLPPEQLLAQNRYKVTWFSVRNELPPVQPLEEAKPAAAKAKGDHTRPRFRLPQRVVANDPAASSQRQMIWDPAPTIELQRDVPSPNLLEWTPPKVQRARFQEVEKQLDAPARQALEAQTAPQIQAAAPAPSVPQLRQPPRLRYQAQPATPADPKRPALPSDAAPAVQVAPGQGLDIGQFQKLSRLRYWMPQQGVEEPGRRTLAAGQAPQIAAASGQTLDVEQFQSLSRLRYRSQDQTATGAEPARRALSPDGNVPAADIAAGPGSPASAGLVELAEAQELASLGALSPPPAPGTAAGSRAVVGVDPTPDGTEPPRGSRGGSFTAGPDGVAGGAGNGSGTAGAEGSNEEARVRIPHLSVSPATTPANTTRGVSDGGQPARGGDDRKAADRDTVLRKFREADLSPVPAVGVAVPKRLPDPELPFPGRSVYTLAINMPNVSSYSGSWIIEFAELKEDKKAPGEIEPPSPRLKVDPIYSRSAMDEHIEGEVVLHAMIRRDGLVDYIQVLKGLDGRLDESAKEALAKWRFQPATKNGVPIDVETVVRIPFRLAPPKDDRKH